MSAAYAGRSVVISGASSGVGEALARLLAAQGARVALLARNGPRLARIADEIASSGGDAFAAVTDVRDAVAVRDAVEETVARFGAIDLAVANAGIGTRRALDQLDDAYWRDVIDTNLTGAFWLCRATGLQMRAQGRGSIVTVASGLGLVGMSGQVAYCAAKGGLVVMTKALAAELAPTVRVNCLAPGGIDTPMTEQDEAVSDDLGTERARAMQRVPLGRLAAPEEIATAIAWVGSDEFSFATGSIVSMDGGVTAI